MTPPAVLIAEREFRAYTTTASFWVALALGPIVMAGAFVLSASGHPPPPEPVAIVAADPALAAATRAAVTEAAAIEARHLNFAASAAPEDVVLVRKVAGDIEVTFPNAFPLSGSGRALVARTIERDEAVRQLSVTKTAERPENVVAASAPAPATAHRASSGAVARFCLVMMLWMTLTGSLGMLLQAVVRERANRALEGLLAAARPWEIVLGKLGGVGAVSLLVLVSWLGSAGAFAALSPRGGGWMQAVMGGLGSPAMLGRAVMIYVLAYAFYGSVTVAVGASARDSASAQNLARPMFAVLLAAFFAAITTASGSDLGWLLYAPPFTPFLLLLSAPERLSLVSQLTAEGLMLLGTVAAGWFAVSRVTLTGAAERSRREVGTAMANVADAY